MTVKTYAKIGVYRIACQILFIILTSRSEII